jgi:PhnB protein
MSIKKINPYIHFNGTAEKAISLYERALDAKTESISRYGDVPGMQVPPEQKSLIMHAVLRIGEGAVMVSDTTPDRPIAAEGNVQIALDFTEPAGMAKAFEALAAGGKVTLPFQETFWGAKFGMLTDVYGVRWMFNCELKKT